MANLTKILKEIVEDAFHAWQQMPPVGAAVSKEDLFDIIRNIGDASSFSTYGIRSINSGETPKLFGHVKPSKVWKEDEVHGGYVPTRFNADGASAVSIDAKPWNARYGVNVLDLSEIYPGNKYLLRADEELPLQPWNIDEGEVVLNNPRVLAGFEPQKDGKWKRILGLAGGGIAAGSVLGGGEAQASTYPHADANNLDRTIERLSKARYLNDMASSLIPTATQASVQPINNMGVWQQMEQQGRVTPDLPVPEAEWSPVDLATAPIGAAGTMGKLAAMALDAPTTLAVNRLIDALGAGANTASNWWNGK